jgi:hypothetical protein
MVRFSSKDIWRILSGADIAARVIPSYCAGAACAAQCQYTRHCAPISSALSVARTSYLWAMAMAVLALSRSRAWLLNLFGNDGPRSFVVLQASDCDV